MVDNIFRPAAKVPRPHHFHQQLPYLRPDIGQERPRGSLWLKDSSPPLHVYPPAPRLHARAAQARLPRRLFRPLQGMDQMPRRGDRTRGTEPSGQDCNLMSDDAARTSSLRVVPCARRAVKAMPDTGSSRSTSCQLFRRHNRSDTAQGGG
jgi:hypothetical protein